MNMVICKKVVSKGWCNRPVKINGSPVSLTENAAIFRKTEFLKNSQIFKKLELMFMKHYAPNRCLYIKVAKIRTGVGRTGGGGQGRCELRSEVFVKIPKKDLFFFWGGGGVGGGGRSVGGVFGCHRVDVTKELKFL